MSWIALKMLVGDRAKFFGIVLGLTFAALLINQQGSIFCGLMCRTAGQVYDIRGADLWVMDANVRYIDDVKPMIENNLHRIRGVDGVAWAVPLYKGNARAKLNSFAVDPAGRPVFVEVLPEGDRGEAPRSLDFRTLTTDSEPKPRQFVAATDPKGNARLDEAGRPLFTDQPEMPKAPPYRFAATATGAIEGPGAILLESVADPSRTVPVVRKKHEVIEQVILLGLDDASMVGAPTTILAGELADLRKPDAVIVDYARLQKLYPGEAWKDGGVATKPISEVKFAFIRDAIGSAQNVLAVPLRALSSFVDSCASALNSLGLDCHPPGWVIADAPDWRAQRAELNRNFYSRFLGRELEMNDTRAVIVGICEATRTFQSNAVVYTTFSRTKRFVPKERKMLSYVLAKVEPGREPRAVAEAIRSRTGLKAVTRVEFVRDTIQYYMKYTGIPINFGITAMLGFLVGTAIAGQTFYNFTLDNIRQFGALKAMGATNPRIVGMILLQALVVGLLGYGLGVGLAAFFGEATKGGELAFYTPWLLLPGTGGAVVLICVLSSVLSVRRVLVLEPAVVFRG